MKNAVCRFFTVTLIACGLAGCAGVLSELPDSDDTLTYQDAAGDFSKARDYALNTYVFYDKAAGNQSFLARRVGAVAIPAAGTMIGLATADAVSTETIALAGIGGSTAFATGRYLVNEASRLSYQIGREAIGCGLEWSGNFIGIDKRIDTLAANRNALSGLVEEVKALIADLDWRINRFAPGSDVYRLLLVARNVAVATRDQATGMETKLVADQAAAEDQYLDQVAAKLAGYVRHVRQAIARKVEDSQLNFDGLKEDFARAIAAADAAVPDKPAVKSGDSQDEVDAVKGLSLGLPLNDPGSLQKGLDDGFLTKNELTERLNWSGLVSRFNDLRGRLKTAMQKAQDDGMLLAKKLEIAGSPDVTTAEQCKTLFDAELAKVDPIAIEPFQLQYDLSQGAERTLTLTGGGKSGGKAAHAAAQVFKSSGAAPDLEFDVTNADAESALTLRPAATPQLPAPTLYQLRVTALSAKALTITVMVSPAAAPKIPQTVEGEHRYANAAPSEEEVAAILEAFRALDSDPVKDLDKDFKAADRRKLEPFEILRGYVEEIQMAMNMPPDQIDGVLGAQETRPKIKALNNGNEKLTKDFVAAILATPKFTAPHEPVADTKLEGGLRANGEVLKEFATAIGLPEADLADNTKVRAKINEKRAELKLPQSGTVTRLFLRLAAPELAKKVIVPEAPPKQS